jgi:hypothetical protein
MADGRTVVVSYGHMPADGDARLRRLEMLVRTFAQSLAEEHEPGSRSPSSAPTTLSDELRALAMRAQAVDALVIDTDSPIVWGSAQAAGASTQEREGRVEVDAAIDRFDHSRRQLVDEIRGDGDDDANDDDSNAAIDVRQSLITTHAPSPSKVGANEEPSGSGAALSAVPPLVEAVPAVGSGDEAVAAARALPGISSLHKGRHLHHAATGGPWFIAQSFAGIYLLVVVFEGPYDELRAERAIVEGLPRIERMVLALPPLDPEPAPTAEVIRMRRRR